MSVARRTRADGKPYWVVRWWEGPQQRSKTFSRAGDAADFEAAMRADKRRGTWIDERDGRIPFGVYAKQWREAQAHRPGTAALYERVLRLHVLPLWEKREIGSLRHSDAQRLLTSVRKKLKPNTARQVHAITRTILRSAVADRLIPVSPFERISLPAVQVPRDRRPPPVEQIRALAAATAEKDPRTATLVTLGFASGLRIGELLGLEVEHVDFLRRKEVRVAQQLVRVPGGQRYIGPPKTPQSVRTVPLPQYALDTLAAYLAAHPAEPIPVLREVKGERVESTARLIFQADKGGPANRTTLDARLAKAPGPTLRPHDLRHAYASELVNGGIPERAVMEWLGHTPPGVTLRVYTHVLDDAADRARKLLTDLWTGEQETPAVADGT